MAKWLDKYEQGGMVLKKKTKDNYGKRENANEGYSTAGPGWIGEGTTNKGFNYNGAWGGTMAMGGALPGAVGFTYARTQDPAPSNGPYAKKTKASAQNGSVIKDDRGQWAYPGEVTEIGSNDITMQGVDYPVLGVSDTGDTQMMYPDQDYKFDGEKVTEFPMAQDGGWLDKYQDGGNINKKLKEEAEERLARMNRPKATLSQYTPEPGEQAKFDKQKLDRIAEDNAPLNRMAASKGAENMQDAALFALDVMTAGEASLALKTIAKPALKAAAKYATEKTALKNAYKLNPKAFKANPEAFYRQVYGDEAYNSFLQHGPKTVEQITSGRSPAGQLIDMTKNWPSESINVIGANETIASKVMPNTNTLPYFKKGNPYYSPSFGEREAKEYLFETKPGAKDIEDFVPGSGFNIHDINSPLPSAKALSSYEGRNVLHPMSEFNSPENYNVYQRDWLKGYKQVKQPTSTQQVTRGPVNYWEEPGFAKRNPNFNPEAYANSPIGNTSALRDIPEGMTPYIKVDDFTPNVKPSWKSQELPGLHLSATMEGGPISKIIEPKTGLINVDQALTIIGKESGGASKVDMIKQVLGKDIPKKMDYNDFRKTVQDQLIPLEREVVDIDRSAYGINNIGFTKSKGLYARKPQAILDNIEYTKNHILKLEKTGDPSFKKYIGNLKQDLDYHLKEYNNIPLENQTIRLSNRSKFGKGADTHGNPEETLGHIHFLRDAESPDVLTMTQLQSDAFQSTNRTMPKSLEEANAKLNKLKDDANYNPSVRADYDVSLEEAAVKNFSQKSLLDKNHQERYLQELVDYAGKRGDINKIRVPTSETAAKVQGYKPTTTSSKVFEEYNKLKGTPEYEQLIANSPDADKVRLEKILKGDIKGDIYDLSNETILKKYSEQPKVIKKAFGVEPKTVTDSKGNSWYEFDIPAKFKGGKGEIKAFKDGGWLNKYK